VPRFNRLSLSLASTAAVALASLPLGITPASAAKVTEGTTSSIGVVETSSNASQFHLKTQDGQSLAQSKTAAEQEERGRGGRGKAGAILQQLLEFLGITRTNYFMDGW